MPMLVDIRRETKERQQQWYAHISCLNWLRTLVMRDRSETKGLLTDAAAAVLRSTAKINFLEFEEQWKDPKSTLQFHPCFKARGNVRLFEALKIPCVF